MSDKNLTIINHPRGYCCLKVNDNVESDCSIEHQATKGKTKGKFKFVKCDCYDKAINSIIETMPLKYYKSIEDEKSLHITDNSIVETMPLKCYEHVHARNSLHITDLGIKYLAKSIFNAHYQAGHCLSYKEGAYKFEAKQLAERIVFNKQKNCPELIKSDLGMSDLDGNKFEVVNIFDFMLSYYGEVTESKVVGNQNQKKPNPMNQAGYFE